MFASWVGVHPLALTRYATLPIATQREIDRVTAGYADKKTFFIDRLAQGIGTIAAAFYPRPVILRFSDFKTNEYARLVGGSRSSRGGESDARMARREPVLPPSTRRDSCSSVRPSTCTRGIRSHQREAHDPVLSDAGGRGARARDDGEAWAGSRRERSRGAM